MADIAILVAEEYERRVRHTAGSRSASVEFDWWKKFPAKMTVGVNEKKIESLMKKFEAKSQFALAISNGFFSA
ncbi:hypothetical protein EUTSA_v10005237mg [Eutrema salsugineum]|uniref:Uncharacterized protein n=1 Tax=Eutrema salsugineum TaxID=72664 RepID=V4KN36_EUTSA|nr:uncharacterized protein LOC18011749 [Eutrema salsugineum]ESQ31352.1 hypothetical protein EUTSA_v10005237mg [Eutrema salsugineum]